MRSTIDYGCFVYGAAAKTHLNKLERVQEALRICSGAMWSILTKAIQVELRETLLDREINLCLHIGAVYRDVMKIPP